MRFESNNRTIKNYTNVCGSRRNLPLSVAKKNVLKFSYLVFNDTLNQESENNYKYENIENKCYINTILNVFTQEDSLLIKAYAVYKYKGCLYKNNYYIFKADRLYKIIDIIKHEEEISLVLSQFSILYKDHYQCFMVLNELNVYIIETLKWNNFFKPFLLFNLPKEGLLFFKIRYL